MKLFAIGLPFILRGCGTPTDRRINDQKSFYNKNIDSQFENYQIRYVDPIMETTMNVDCDNFDASFASSEITIKIPKNAMKFQLIKSAYDGFTVVSNNQFDARLKICRDSNKYIMDQICMNQFGYFIKLNDGKTYKNEKLKSLLKAICN